MKTRWTRHVLAAALVAVGITASVAHADGTETLGAPGISLDQGTGVLAAGVGTVLGQPGSFSFTVPGTAKQSLLYWTGHYSQMLGGAGDDTIYVRNGSAAPVTSTFGNTTPEAGFACAGADRKFGNFFALPADGIVTKLTAHMKGAGDASGLAQDFRAMIYDDNGAGGTPGDLLAVSQSVSIPEAMAAANVDFGLAQPRFLAAGTYFLALHSGSNNTKGCLSQTTPSPDPAALNYYNVDAFANGPSDPYGAANVQSAGYTISATYEDPGTAVTGQLIGGPKLFFTSGVDFRFATYRADITSLGLVSGGSNTLLASGLGFTGRDGLGNDGAGVIVTYDDGTDATTVGIRDGQDLAFDPSLFLPTPTEVTLAERQTVSQSFAFAASTADRTAQLVLLAASVEGEASGFGPLRPNRVEVTFGLPGGAGDTTIMNPFSSGSGPEFDADNHSVTVPAGATQMTVQALSLPDPSDPAARPASFAWTAASLSIENLPPPGGGQGCTPGYWKNHDGSKKQGNAWAATPYTTTQLLSSVFSPAGLGSLGSTTLRQALELSGGPTLLAKKQLLVHHAVAALLNAANSGVSYGLTTAEIVSAVNATLLGNNGTTILALKDDLDGLNNAGCPLGNVASTTSSSSVSDSDDSNDQKGPKKKKK